MNHSFHSSFKFVIAPALALVAAILLVAPRPAHAAPTLFNIDGQYSSPTAGTFTGTMQVDTSSRSLLAFDLVFPGIAPFTFNDVQNVLDFTPSEVGVQALNADNDGIIFAFTTTNHNSDGTGSLVGFSGGTIINTQVLGNSGVLFTGFSGNVARAAVSVPEPADLGVFGLGVLLLGGFVSVRRRGQKRTS